MENELEVVDAEDKRPLGHKHDSGEADLQRVTDYQEEKELPSQITQSTVTNILDTQKSKRRARQQAKTVQKADVEFIINEMEVSRPVAEKVLMEHNGNLKEALKSMLAL